MTTAERQQNWMRCNERFHAALISAPENTILSETIERLSHMPLVSPKAIPLIAGATEDQQFRLKRAHEDHQDIFEAITNGNGLRVEMLMREHASRNIKNKRANFWKMKAQANWNDLPGLNLVVPSD